jgi:hypothetical protein
MIRAVVFLTATLLSASLGAVVQNSSNPAGSSVSTRATATAQDAPAAPSNQVTQGQATTGASNGGTEGSAQNGSQQDNQDPRTASAELPQTSTILPLLGLLGLGSLVAGLFARR